ncbi:putative HTH-type transcriptional regulator YulB [Capsulimonas corticalis]|uniref:HTH-type transcriptional regulator YulB n=1 Tax=Capsulimonas corticalis TaxID=2219043 RepID=A0A402CZD8_9BACT|nr:DeoR/GlpR family DNA-binding transcription regulator [Capsulimonas corticalis]BDI29464.1 putative HTH-type transcriptional regulator YulB [Capsulimonas corticalis]
MLAAERQREIAIIVDRERGVRVSQLAQQFQVADETIRRDLEKLEAEGKLVRSHGGAMAAQHGGREATSTERAVSFVPEKAAIARRAVEWIEEGDTVMVDASSTALHLVQLIPDIPLTLLTNSLQVCNVLAERRHIRVVCTGGTLAPASLSFLGSRAEQMLSDYHVNHLFFSCTGIDFEFGLSDVNEAQATMKQRMLAISDHNYLLVNKSKFGVRSLRRFGSLSDIKTVVTVEDLDPAIIAGLANFGIDVAIAANN